MYSAISTVDQVIDTLSYIYYCMIIAYVLLSWLPNIRDSFIGELLGRVVEPYLSPFRRFIPPIGGMLDISPIIALFALRFVVLGLKEIVNFILGLFA